MLQLMISDNAIVVYQYFTFYQDLARNLFLNPDCERAKEYHPNRTDIGRTPFFLPGEGRSMKPTRWRITQRV
jgi:hypothetical protein